MLVRLSCLLLLMLGCSIDKPHGGDHGASDEQSYVLAQLSFSAFLKSGCQRFFKHNEKSDCNTRVRDFQSYGQWGTNWNGFSLSVGSETLHKLLYNTEDHEFSGLMSSLRQELILKPKAGERSALWQAALEWSHGNGARALDALATVLQDTSPALMHVPAAGPQLTLNLDQSRRERARFDAFRKLMTEVSSSIRPVFQKRAGAPSELLPPFLQIETSSPYHFYVPAYLTRNLKQNAKCRQCWITPFAMTIEYETRSKGLQQLAFGQLKSVDWGSPQHADSLIDIYSGYAGSIWAGSAQTPLLLSFDVFRTKWISNPDAFLQELKEIHPH